MEHASFFTRMYQSNRMLNGGCGTPIYFAIILFIAFFLVSCATKRKTIEKEHVKTEIKADTTTTQAVKTDSTTTYHKTDAKEKEKVEKETKVEKYDSTVVVVDNQGNVVKQETWHKEKETVSQNREYERLLLDSLARFKQASDSLRQYVSRCDSLQEKLSKKENVVVEKIKIPKWCWYCLGFSILVLIFAFVKFIRWLRII